MVCVALAAPDGFCETLVSRNFASFVLELLLAPLVPTGFVAFRSTHPVTVTDFAELL
jgi:hypothetical protein